MVEPLPGMCKAHLQHCKKEKKRKKKIGGFAVQELNIVHIEEVNLEFLLDDITKIGDISEKIMAHFLLVIFENSSESFMS